MSDPTPPNDDVVFDSSDMDILDIDVPGDTTVRPCRPVLRAYWEAMKAKHASPEKAKPEGKNGEGEAKEPPTS